MPLVMLALWNAVAAKAPIEGLTQTEIARYFACTLVVRQLTSAWIVWELNQQIRTGGLSPKLLRPVNPLFVEAATMLAALPMRLVILVPLLCGLLIWRPDLWITPSIASLALFAVSVAMAWMIGFLIQAIFGMMSFWFDQSMGLFGVWFALYALCSGYIAPMRLFPPSVRGLLDVLPFRAMLATPVEVLGGFLTPTAALPLVATQAIWLVVLAALAALMWNRGVRRYGAYGA
jgi:ABC-2 type transport system permease protein